jgi:MYXO-CTERM domain-containing protein
MAFFNGLLAGSGAPGTPLFATITARSHLDITSGLPAVNDYQAGVITLTKENTSLPDGKDEGLGVRAFRVNGTTALRTFGAQGRPLLEGSKEISGGTGPSAYDPSDPNGPPHVDEEVLVTFAGDQLVAANSVVVTLSKFDATDKLWLTINLVGGAVYTNTFLGVGSAIALVPGGTAADKVYNLSFADLGAGFGANTLVESFSIRAVDDDPANPRGTAEHFLITGFRGDVVPTPGAAVLFGIAGLTAIRRRR